MSVGLLGCIALLVGTTTGVVVEGLLAAGVALTIAISAVAVAWPQRVLILLAIGAAGMAYGAQARDTALRDPPAALLSRDPVTRTGVLLSDATLTPTGARVELLVDGRRVRATVAGMLVQDEVSHWRRGRTFSAPMTLRMPDVVRNPGAASITWQTMTRRFDLIGTVKSAALVGVHPGRWWEEAAAQVRAHVRRTAAHWLGPRSASAQGVVTAILIGDRAGLDVETTRRLQAAGIFHVIAISGGNVAMLTVACLLVLRLGARAARWPTVVTIGVVAAYGVVVAGDPSVTRAVVAAILYLGLDLAGLRPRPVNLLAVVAVVCAAWDPLTVVDVGAWLSFGATFGLIVVLPRLLTAVRGTETAHRTFGLTVWHAVRAACLATVAAEIVILPVTVGVFARVTVAGIVLNLIAIPAMALIQFSGLALSVLALLWAPAAEVAAWVAHAATLALLACSDAIDLAPWLSWRVPPTSLWWTGAYYAAVATVLLVPTSRWRRGAVAVAFLLAVVVVTSPFVALRRPAPGWLRVTVLDVGQGDAILVQTPGRHALLVDAGGSSSGTFDVGGRIVTPGVWALGERQLDWLAVTHGDIDHAGGARRLIDDLRPREIWEGIPVGSDRTLQDLRAAAQRRGIAWRRVLAGHELEAGSVRIRALHPPPPDWYRVRVRNDDSLVLEIRYGEVAVLLTGDAGVEFESAPPGTVRAEPPARIRILKVGHHGSRTSTSDRFLDAVDPRVALVSAGAGNLFGHPAPAVLARLRARNVHVFRTDRHGALIVETDGRAVRVRAMTGKTLDVF